MAKNVQQSSHHAAGGNDRTFGNIAASISQQRKEGQILGLEIHLAAYDGPEVQWLVARELLTADTAKSGAEFNAALMGLYHRAKDRAEGIVGCRVIDRIGLGQANSLTPMIYFGFALRLAELADPDRRVLPPARAVSPKVLEHFKTQGVLWVACSRVPGGDVLNPLKPGDCVISGSDLDGFHFK